MNGAAPLAVAMWFGHEDARSFAMVHRPPVPGRHGVVICNALGFEGLIAHRPLRHLATALARRGRTVLRLDYEDSGDAIGDRHGPDELAPAIEGIDDAVTYLRDHEGCTEISVIGIRAGATLACLYGIKHPGIQDLVLWAPCERGSMYVRELKAMHRLSAASRPGGAEPADPDGRLEVVGFQFSPTLLGELAEVDLASQLTGPPAARVLLLQRDDQPVNEALHQSMTSTGAAVTVAPSARWADFMVDDETLSVLPESSIEAITSWLCHRDDAPVAQEDVHTAAIAPAAQSRPPIVVLDRITGDGFTERWEWIAGRLFAIVTEPADDVPVGGRGADPSSAGRPVVVLSNTGSVNRTGPGRLYTQLAREWARLGFTAIRVDLGGTGDSTTANGEPENQPYAPARIEELMDVVRWTKESLHAGDTTLFGICSGAYQSFHAALSGSDVRQAIMVNPAIYYLGPDQTVDSSTSKAMIASHNLWRASFIRQKVVRAVRNPKDITQFVKRARRGVSYTTGAAARRALRRVGINLPEREHLARDLSRLADDDIEMVFVFAAAEPGLHYLQVFGDEALQPSSGPPAATIIEIAGGDHVFSPPQARRAMTAAVTDQLVARGPAIASGPRVAGQG